MKKQLTLATFYRPSPSKKQRLSSTDDVHIQGLGNSIRPTSGCSESSSGSVSNAATTSGCSESPSSSVSNVAAVIACSESPSSSMSNAAAISGYSESSSSFMSNAAVSSNSPSRSNPLQNSDVGLVLGKVTCLSDADKYNLIKNPYIPPQSYKFPRHSEHGKQRCFQHFWLSKYAWLVYSKELDGGVCLACALFCKPSGLHDRVLVERAMCKYTKATDLLKEHSIKKSHIDALQDMDRFKSIMEQRTLPVHHQIHTALQMQVSSNQAKLMSILKTVVFCGRQNIPLRGHRDDSKHLNECVNIGNFQALLDFRVDAGDEILRRHFNIAPRNATYRSKTIQNELIESVGSWIRQEIVDEVKKAGFFSILADETTDCSNKEQLTLVLRFVDGQKKIREEFIEFVEAPATTGQALAELLLSRIELLGLDANLLCGQGYDGAANMSGRQSGAAVRIRQIYPLALYMHCNSHVLNLCIVKASEIQAVRNIFGIMIEVALFFNGSPKRQALLESKINILVPESRKKRLADLCRTRWVERHEAFESLYSLYNAVVQSLEDVVTRSSQWSRESISTANGLLLSLTQFDFLVTFVITKNCLSYLKSLSISLQCRSIDICHAFNDVECIKLALTNVREKIDTYHAKWYEEAVDLGQVVGANEPHLPRFCAKQKHRLNIPAESPQEYYRRAVSIPFLDHLILQMQERFSEAQKIAYQGLSIVPEVMKSDQQWRKGAKELASFYDSNLPSPQTLDAELDCWETKWLKDSAASLPSSPCSTLQCTSDTIFPNICCLLRILCTLPVTTSECERTFSSLKCLKTYTRSTMKEERLSGLALIYIHKDMELDYKEIINIFARKYPRRLKLINILDSD